MTWNVYEINNTGRKLLAEVAGKDGQRAAKSFARDYMAAHGIRCLIEVGSITMWGTQNDYEDLIAQFSVIADEARESLRHYDQDDIGITDVIADLRELPDKIDALVSYRGGESATRDPH